MGNGQEFEVVKAKVPRGFVRTGTELVVGVPQRGDLVRGNVHCPYLGECSVFLRPILLKPDWNPPVFNKGWVTWDLSGWWWWENRPEYHAVDSWTYPQSGCVFERQQIGSVISKILGFPDCNGFDASNCIWEVGQ